MKMKLWNMGANFKTIQRGIGKRKWSHNISEIHKKKHYNQNTLTEMPGFSRKTEEHEMTDFSDKPDEMSMAQQNLNPSSSKKWKMISGTIFVVLIIVVSLIVILPKINSNSGK